MKYRQTMEIESLWLTFHSRIECPAVQVWFSPETAYIFRWLFFWRQQVNLISSVDGTFFLQTAYYNYCSRSTILDHNLSKFPEQYKPVTFSQ